MPVGLATPVGRFVSQPIDVPERCASSFRQAEVRLHRVPQLPRSCFIRVFLNLPDADATTPLDRRALRRLPGDLRPRRLLSAGPGTATCRRRPRKYDLRPRSHNTPRNHRINVTKAARRLIDAGATVAADHAGRDRRRLSGRPRAAAARRRLAELPRLTDAGGEETHGHHLPHPSRHRHRPARQQSRRLLHLAGEAGALPIDCDASGNPLLRPTA